MDSAKASIYQDALIKFMSEAHESIHGRSNLIAIFLDSSKAFDTVSIEILLQKLDYIGVRGVAYRWLQSYLTFRTQYVQINDVNSELGSISIGVPQGSILGPLLFLIYINDMKRSCNLFECIQYADDTTLFLRDDDLKTLYQIVNRQLKRVDYWLKLNKLSLNVEKTHYMVFTKCLSDLPQVVIRDVPLTRVYDTRFLGINIDDKLNFNSHVNKLCKRLSAAIGAIKCVRYFMPNAVIKMLYFALFYPCLLYGVCVWGLSGSGNINKICKLQDRAFSLFLNSNNSNSLASNKLFKFKSLISYCVSVKVHCYLNSAVNLHIKSVLDQLKPAHQHVTRFVTQGNFNLPAARSTKYQQSFIFKSVGYWNEIDPDVRSITFSEKFKRKLKCFLLMNQI